MKAACESSIRDQLARRCWDELDELEAEIENALDNIETPSVRSTLPEEPTFQCIVDYIGAYAYWDIPSGEVDPKNDLEAIEEFVTEDEEKLPVVDREKDPPVTTVWT